jgi:hypothetical protein
MAKTASVAKRGQQDNTKGMIPSLNSLIYGCGENAVFSDILFLALRDLA